MSDLCWECQQNNEAVYRSANLPDDVKSLKVQQQESHLAVVQQERSLYNSMVDDARRVVADQHITALSCSTPNSRRITMHYCFDYAQQVHYPSDPLQPGPMYFLTPRKCGIFGVCCPGIPQQVNYLIDEGMCVGKGSNAVISYLHHFFAHYGLGESSVHLHCDNCSGQNKNKFMIWYLAWRILSNLHTSITVNFMIPGHTKFAPDWCFGLLKQKYRNTRISSLADLSSAVTASTVKGINIPQLVGTEDGTVIVQPYNWQNFLEPCFKSLPALKKIQHFRFSASHPGTVFYRVRLDDPEQAFYLMQSSAIFPVAGDLQRSDPPGLPLERQWYLHNKIREFVRPEAQDITCPLPKNPLPPKLRPADLSPCPVLASVEPGSSKSKTVKRAAKQPSTAADDVPAAPSRKCKGSKVPQYQVGAGHGLLKASRQQPVHVDESGPDSSEVIGKATRTRQVKKPKKYM